jgi:hypothetical protein
MLDACIARNLSIMRTAVVSGSSVCKGITSFSENVFLAGAISIHSFTNLGNLVSVASSLTVVGSISVASENVYIGRDHFNLFAGKSRVITADDEMNGRLVGQWTIDTPLTTSDRRLKKDVTPLERAVEIFETLYNLRPISFVLADDNQNRERFGFIAQDVEKVLPNIVITDECASQKNTTNRADTKSVLYQGLIALLTSVV